MNKITNIIFDFDGTLMDTAPVILATMQATFEELRLPEKTEEECRATIGLRLEEIPLQLFPDRPGIAKEYAATYRRLFPEHNRPGVARPFPGVIETVKRLHAQGCQMAVASSRSRKSLEEFVRDIQLADTFKMLVGGDDVEHGKPSPEPVQKILDSLGWLPSETLVVGDAGVDILMGRSAHCQICAVTYGNGTLAELQSAHPDLIIDDFTRLADAQKVMVIYTK